MTKTVDSRPWQGAHHSDTRGIARMGSADTGVKARFRVSKPLCRRTSDAAAVSALILGEARHITLEPDGRGAEAILDSMHEPAIAANLCSPRFAYWVGVVGEALQGVISLRDGSHLYQMFVPTQLHRNGVGRRLWQHLLGSLATQTPPERITVNASPYGVPAYKRIGFVVTGPRVETKGIAFVPMVFSFSTPSSSGAHA